MPHLRLIVVCLLLLAPLRAQIVISQVYGGGGNAGATLRNDFIELFNRGSSTIDVTGWTVQYASATGDTWATTLLAGAIAPGQYYLVEQAQGAGGTLSLPTPDAAGAIAMSATSAKVALVNDATALSGASPSGSQIVDLVGYGTANFARGTPAPTLSNTTAALRRGGGCTDTGDNSADFTVAGPNPRNSASPFNVCGAGPPPPPQTATPISRIQGARSTSPLVGQFVTTTGIVTALKRNGFFLQTPDAEADTNPNTSEGLFVFTSSTPPGAAARGNLISVSGTVVEFRPAADPSSPPLTELIDPAVTLISTGHTLPAPVTLTRADTSAAGGTDVLERFEGMRVHVPTLSVIGPTGGSINEPAATSTSNGVFYGVIEGIPRPFREPGIRRPDPLPAGAPSGIPRFDANPERLRIASTDQPGAMALEVTSGAFVRSLTGPLDYAFRAYTIVPDPDSQPVVTNLAVAAAVPPPAPGEFTVASFNLQRFFDSTDDASISEPVLTPAAFNNRLNKASLAIRNILRSPDILGVQEVENLAALQALANKLNADSAAAGRPAEYHAFLEEGNDIGGIDVGLLVKSATVTVVGVTQEGKTTTFTNPAGQQEILNDRPPLVLRATIGPSALPVTVIVNHLRSLTGIEDPRVQAKRRAQAEFLAGLIQSRQADNLISIGDYNAFQFNDGYVDVIGTIKGAPAPEDQVLVASRSPVNPSLINLVDTVPLEQNYSFVFDGDAQTLDHILVNSSILNRLSRFAVGRSNADFPQSYRNDPNRPERVSDHDMPVAYFLISPPSQRITAAGVTSAATFLSGAVAPGQIVSIFGAGIGPATGLGLALTSDGQSITSTLGGARVLFDSVAAPMLYAHSTQVNAIVPYALAGRSTTELQLEFQGRRTTPVTLPVSPTAPGIFPGAILNQDYTANTPANAAPRGSIVILYATGEGQTAPPGEDGRITGIDLPRPALPVTVRIGSIDAEVLYAGAAPSLVSGVLQLNVRVPESLSPGSAVPVAVSVGDNTSPPAVTLAVR